MISYLLGFSVACSTSSEPWITAIRLTWIIEHNTVSLKHHLQQYIEHKGSYAFQLKYAQTSC